MTTGADHPPRRRAVWSQRDASGWAVCRCPTASSAGHAAASASPAPRRSASSLAAEA